MQVILRTEIPYQVIVEANTFVEDKVSEEAYNWSPDGHDAHWLSMEFGPVDLNNLNAKSFLETSSPPGFNQDYLKTLDDRELIRMGWKTDMNDFITINYVRPERDSSPDTMVGMFIAYSGRRRYFLDECEGLTGTLVSRALEVIGITMYVHPCPTDGSATLEFRYGTSYGTNPSCTKIVKAPYEYVTSNKDMFWWENQVTYLRRLGHPAQSSFIAENIDKITVKTLRNVSAGEVNEEQLTLSTVLLDVVNNDEDSLYITEELSTYLRQLQSKLS